MQDFQTDRWIDRLTNTIKDMNKIYKQKEKEMDMQIIIDKKIDSLKGIKTVS